MAKKIGLSDLHAFPITREENGVPTYGTPFRVAKSITAALTKGVAEAKLYADDTLDEYAAEMTGMTITFNINELEPDIHKKLLGLKSDSLGGISNSPDSIAPYVALAFRSKLSTGGYEYRVLYKVRFKPVDENFQTKGENITFEQPVLSGEATIREDLRIFDYTLRDTEAAAKPICLNWFKNVVVPKQN